MYIYKHTSALSIHTHACTYLCTVCIQRIACHVHTYVIVYTSIVEYIASSCCSVDLIHVNNNNLTCIVIDVERPVVTPAEHNITLGENVTFDCNEFGSPPFTYQWYMRSVMGTDIILVGESNEFYYIPSTMYNDTGGYVCEASNSLGIVSNSTPANLWGKNARN